MIYFFGYGYDMKRGDGEQTWTTDLTDDGRRNEVKMKDNKGYFLGYIPTCAEYNSLILSM